jgi:uncharacterized damage-inducible protein DinB
MTTSNYLAHAREQFEYYKKLGDSTFAQLSEDQLNWQFNNESNSIATIVLHLSGNMMSRWTDFLTTDGEKEWRNRDVEFDTNSMDAKQLRDYWNAGWQCFFEALDSISDADLQKTIYIRAEPHTVLEAINRQLAHYPYHVGQIVFIGKMVRDSAWQSLSIPRGKSQEYNDNKFGKG